MAERPSQAAREELWIGLSDLFLDTETRWFLPDGASVAVRNGFSWDEVRDIIDYELTPVLGHNLVDIAGEWAGFDQQWLMNALRKAQGEPKGLGAKVKAVVGGRLNQRLYEALRALMNYLLGWPSDMVSAEGKRLSNLARLAIDPVWTKTVGFWSRVRALSLDSTPDQVQTSFRHAIQPIYGPLLVHEGDASTEQMERNWLLFYDLLRWLEQQSDPRDVLLRTLEELAYLFTIEDLANVPRGSMTRATVLELVAPARAEEIWRGPLARLFQDQSRAERNWTQLGF